MRTPAADTRRFFETMLKEPHLCPFLTSQQVQRSPELQTLCGLFPFFCAPDRNADSMSCVPLPSLPTGRLPPPVFRFKFPPHSLVHTHLAHTPRYLICGPWQPDGCLCGLVAGVLPVTEKLVGAEPYPLYTHMNTHTNTHLTLLSPHKPSMGAGSQFPACFAHPTRNLGWINPRKDLDLVMQHPHTYGRRSV